MVTSKQAKLDLRGIGWFLAIAFGFTWLLDLILWITGQGVTGPWALPVMTLSMFAPALAAFVVVKWISPATGIRKATGLRLGVKGTRWGWYYLFAMLSVVVFVLGAIFIGAALGVFPLDLTNYSAYRDLLSGLPGGEAALAGTPIALLVWVQIATLPLAGLINAPVVFGEEYGWRGYLLPALLPLGQWPALILHGVIWGLWHAPIILMGYNYPQHPLLGVGLMVVFTTLTGILMGWTRLATGSVFPAVVMHAVINASGGVNLLLSQAGATIDTAQATLLGWTGWILPLLTIVVLVVTKQLPVKRAATEAVEQSNEARSAAFESVSKPA